MTVRVVLGDARDLGAIATGTVHACVTSPPYWGLRSYLAADDPDKAKEIGQEATPADYVVSLRAVFKEVWRVLREEGTAWVNLGDCYASDQSASGASGGTRAAALHGGTGDGRTKRHTGLAPKSLIGIPSMVAQALRADGWIVRCELPWLKANVMPQSVRDRLTIAHETVLLLAKRSRYYFDADAVRAANGRNARTSDLFNVALDVLESDVAAYLAHIRHVRAHGGMLSIPDGAPAALLVNAKPNRQAHFACWPPALVEPMLKASTPEHGVCGGCGAPWLRQVERTPMVVRPGPKRAALRAAAAGSASHRTACTGTMLAPPTSRTVGWRAGCACGEAPVPATVLDPFGGSGTTAQVAARLGRHCILVELNREYLPLITENTGAIPDAPASTKPRQGQQTIFDRLRGPDDASPEECTATRTGEAQPS